MTIDAEKRAAANPVAENGTVAAAPNVSASPHPAAEMPYMNEAELESHGVATNVERYGFLLIVSTVVLIGAVFAWFYFHG